MMKILKRKMRKRMDEEEIESPLEDTSGRPDNDGKSPGDYEA